MSIPNSNVYILSRSDRNDKKYMVTNPKQHKLYFGAKGYDDYTTHKDPVRRLRYLTRHQHEQWDNLSKPGTWSRWLLWEYTNFNSAIKNMERLFGIKIICI